MTGPYRDKAGSGGYTYRQWSDGTIKIIAGPNSVGREIPPRLEDPVWRAITLEIGAPKALQLALQQYVAANPPKVVGTRQTTAAPATSTARLSTLTQIAQALTQGGAASMPSVPTTIVDPSIDPTPTSSIPRGVIYAGGALLGLGAFAALFTVLTRRRR